VLIAIPSLFGSLILGIQLSEPARALGRIAGIAMLALALACRPVATSQPATAVHAPLVYNVLATIYLAYLGFGSNLVGALLWPAVVLHAVLAILIIRARLVGDGK
jgi:hypothetical protein